MPWGIAFLPDGSALVTERDSGRVLQVGRRSRCARSAGSRRRRPRARPACSGVAVSPSYARDQRVFFYATAESDNRVLRTTFEDGRLGELDADPHRHPQGVQPRRRPDDLRPRRDALRLHRRGRAARPRAGPGLAGRQDPADHPGRRARRPATPTGTSPIWTWGHRNVQGLAFDDAGNLWASEFGQDTFDELNLIEKGRNYGWPEVEGKGDEPGSAEPAGHLVDRRGLALRAGVRRRPAVARRAAGASGCGGST